jgi:ComF family protein
MRAAIHALKYERLHPAAKFLGSMLAQAISQLRPGAPGMLVIPVPLHRSKHAERGFNQARALTEHALRLLRKTHPAWQLDLAPGSLMRQRATKNQAGLTSRERRLNVRGAFIVADPAAVAGKDILLIDDIFTTGATLRAASRTLLRAGAASVRVATLARARMIHQRPARLTRQPAAGTAALPDSQSQNSQAKHDTSHPNNSVPNISVQDRLIDGG